ncbi:MAG: glycosyltransferase family protein, partial [Nitrospiria bacterium]
MKRLMVYSHDTYGLGNIRRMLSICSYLTDHMKDLSTLLISSSPVIHSFYLPDRLDYLKLPCLTRSEEEGYSVKFLGTGIAEVMNLRSELIRAGIMNFKPDLFLVDKKPFGVKDELKASLNYLKRHLPKTKLILLLRDILDKPESTIRVWKKNKFHEAIQLYYDQIQVVGASEVFDLRKEYQYPAAVSKMTHFCGYIAREPGRKGRRSLRNELGIGKEKLVLVTPGGGADGYRLLDAYIDGIELIPNHVKSLVISGPEMPIEQQKHLSEAVARYPSLEVCEFTDDMMSYMEAADVVVSMGGYNTICEILTLRKRAVVVPRVKPVEEQWIRAERMAR